MLQAHRMLLKMEPLGAAWPQGCAACALRRAQVQLWAGTLAVRPTQLKKLEFAGSWHLGQLRHAGFRAEAGILIRVAVLALGARSVGAPPRGLLRACEAMCPGILGISLLLEGHAAVPSQANLWLGPPLPLGARHMCSHSC